MNKTVPAIEKMPDNQLKRNAFVRISAVNHISKDNEELGVKKGDVVTYTLEEIKNTLDTWNSTKKFNYFLIQHNEPDNIHFHIVIDFDDKSSCKFQTLKNKFPYGKIDKCESGVKACVRYLKHEGRPEKTQYEWSDIITNAPDKLEEYKTPSYTTTLNYKTRVFVDKIVAGEIKQYELKKIPSEIYTQKAAQIKNAFEYRERILVTDPNRNIDIYVLQGSPRVGKTTFCKKWAENNHKSICFSSSSRDPWQDYGGQDIFVYDDFDHKQIDIEDFKKALDPYTNTTMSKRYKNSMFMGDTIFICTNTPITDWFPYGDDKSREAIFKRINFVLDFKSHDELSDFSALSIIDLSKIPKYSEWVSYYTVNKIVLTDNIKNIYDRFNTVVNSYREAELQPIDNELHKFDLKKYINFNADETKKEKFLKQLAEI